MTQQCPKCNSNVEQHGTFKYTNFGSKQIGVHLYCTKPGCDYQKDLPMPRQEKRDRWRR